ncbi:hypothetical protein CR194_00740 [Salipaludibacillus keqinensis]|uniref:YhaN AAA domain-containing protein n=1 Tax=Salipaludibacillus keqinensis TaxID=2045207 RepID=A0A323TG44_9BACI|nr:AAA family ATPase [Salipaludibacillus keqinensis]PYZ94102.1 hypothetical protein CR194_00740 [Salipaludibacillus keqinensis]
MKLKKIQIYGFGKWIDQSWDLSEEPLSLFVGHNESGKSTLMAFIHAIFFGFPSKRENQYLPRDSNKYGGTLIIDLYPYENLSIQRVGGRRQKGHVTIHYPDGRTGDEQDLHTLLKGLDVNTFKGIFHFDLDGLQEMKGMTPKELNRYLYDAGMTGASKLASLEKSIEQMSDRLFKPRGKKTEINDLANQLNELKQSLQKWEDQLNNYGEIQASVREIEQTLVHMNHEQKKIQQQLRKLDKRMSLSKVANDWNALKQQIDSQENIERFPLNGVDRLDQLNELLAEKGAKRLHEKEKIQEKYNELELLVTEFLDEQTAMNLNMTVEQLPLYKNWQDEEIQLSFKEGELVKQQKFIEEEWVPYTKNEFHKANIHGFIIDKYEQLKEKWQLLCRQEESLTEEKNRYNREKTVIEQQLEYEKEHLLSAEDEREYEQSLLHHGNEKIIKKEKEMLIEQQAWIKKDKERLESSIKSKMNGLYSFMLVIAMLAVYQILVSDYALLIFLFISSVILLFFIRKTRVDHKRETEKLEAEDKEKKDRIREFSMEEAGTVNVVQLEQILRQNQERKIQVDVKTQKITSIRQQMAQWEEDRNQLLKEWTSFHDHMAAWTEEASLPSDKEVMFYGRFLSSIKEWKQINRECLTIIEKRSALQKKMTEYENSVYSLSTKCQVNVPIEATVEEQVRALKQLMKSKMEMEEEKRRLNDQVALSEDVLLQTEQELKQIKRQKQELLAYAEVEHEETFRSKAEQFAEQQRMTGRLREWDLQMMAIIPDKMERDKMIQEIFSREMDEELEQDQLNERLNQIEQQKNELLTSLSHEKLELKQLEEEGTYEEQLQRFMTRKEKLNNLVKQWAVFKTSEYMIQKVKAIYEKERQPKVMKKAQEIFSKLTEAKYPYLFAPLGEERFLVERNDGQRFEPNKLSRGTCELLYLSIRLSLAIEDSTKWNFPLFMDETLVNMDKQRRGAVLDYLHEVSRKRQILFFTCHDHIKDEVDRTKLGVITHVITP